MHPSLRASFVVLVLASAQGACAPLALQSRAHGLLFSDATMSAAVTQNGLNVRQGQACAHSILGLATWGNGGAAEAAKEGAIEYVASVDERSFSVLGIYAKVCTIVSGASAGEVATFRAGSAPRAHERAEPEAEAEAPVRATKSHSR